MGEMMRWIVLSILLCASLSFKQRAPRFGRSLFEYWMSETVETVDASKFRIFESGNLDSLLVPQKASDIEAFKKVNKVFEQSLNAVGGFKDQGSIFEKIENPTSNDDAKESVLLFAERTKNLESGCILLNYWKQEAVLITRYDKAAGAIGVYIGGLEGEEADSTRTLTWPPLALETEVVDDLWQVVRVSENIADGSVMKLLPKEVQKSGTVMWELIVLLLLSQENTSDAKFLQALLDTGLSPRKGLIAFMRLSQRINERIEVIGNVPEYRRISEKDISGDS